MPNVVHSLTLDPALPNANDLLSLFPFRGHELRDRSRFPFSPERAVVFDLSGDLAEQHFLAAKSLPIALKKYLEQSRGQSVELSVREPEMYPGHGPILLPDFAVG